MKEDSRQDICLKYHGENNGMVDLKQLQQDLKDNIKGTLPQFSAVNKMQFGSASYWRAQKSKILQMIQTHGNPWVTQKNPANSSRPPDVLEVFLQKVGEEMAKGCGGRGAASSPGN